MLVKFGFSDRGNCELYAGRTKLEWVLMEGRKFKKKNVNVNRTEMLHDTERFWQTKRFGTLSKTDPYNLVVKRLAVKSSSEEIRENLKEDK